MSVFHEQPPEFYSQNPEKRILRLRHGVPVRPEVQKWNGKEVTVLSWHENISMKELFPDDELVGFVYEFGLDIPKSELCYD